MKTWQSFLDSLNTSGGHIFILLTVAAVCGIAYAKGITAAGPVGGGAIGIMYYAMRGGVRQTEPVKEKSDEKSIDPAASKPVA